MAYTQSEIDALRKAIATGVLEVVHGDTRTTYRNLRDMKAILADMEAEVNGTRKRTVARYSSGV